MVQKITKGIKIAVKTTYDGTVYRNNALHHAFSYYISIENTTKETVQLLDRFWEISDALNATEYVEGEGVVGQKPTLKPDEVYTYRSHCLLIGSTGAMKGSFTMLQLNTSQKFTVSIPSFQLTAAPVLN